MVETIPVFVGFDPREAIAYHVCCQSIIERASVPVAFHPLHLGLLRQYKETHGDGSNAFIYSRFLIPWMMGFSGHAIFVDGDMIVKADIAELWAERDLYSAVKVVKHDYKTKAATKYLGNKNENYPRKNWSSVILWNCGHPKNAILTPQYVMKASGRQLHRFEHLADSDIGDLPKEWNWMPQEEGPNQGAKLLHYTLGVPGIEYYAKGAQAEEWFWAHGQVNYIQK